MRRTIPAVLALLVLAACHANVFPDYSPKIETLRVSTFAPRGPYVDLGENGGASPIRMVANVVNAAAGEGLRARVSKIATPDRLATNLNTTLAREVGKRFPFELTGDPQAATDGILEVTVHDYGIVSYGASPSVWRLRADARVVFQPENKVVWQTVEVFETPVRQGAGGAEGLPIVSDALNIAALSKVTDEELQAMFDRLATDAGVAIADRMLAQSRR